MADNLIQVGAVVDLGQYKAGMQEAVATTEAATQEISASFEKANVSSREAMAGMAFAVEDSGIKMSRHFRRLLTEIPLLNAAFTAMMPVLAAGIALDVLKRVGEKIGELISDTFIFTAAMKAEDAALASANKNLEAQAARLKALGRETELAAEKSAVGKEKLKLAFALEDLGGDPKALKAKIDADIAEIARLKPVLAGLTSPLSEAKATTGKDGAFAEWQKSVDETKGKLSGLENEILAYTAALRVADAETKKTSQTISNDLAVAADKAAKEEEARHTKFVSMVYAERQAMADKAAAHETELAQETQAVFRETEKQNQEIINAANKQLAAWDEAYKGQIEAAKQASEIKIQQITQDFERGKINQQKEIALIAKAKQDELQLEVLFHQKREALWAGDLKKVQEVENAISKAVAQSALVGAKATTDGLKVTEQKWKSFADSVSSTLNSALSGWMQGTETFGQAWAKMADDMALRFIASLERQLVEMIVNAAMKDAVDQAYYAKSGLRAAISAAKKSFDWASQFVGPVLAAPIAAAAFVAVEAFGSYDVGTNYVPMDGLAMLHKGEQIIPASQQGPAYSGGSGNQLHVHFNVSAIDGQGVKEHLDKFGNHYADKFFKLAKRKGYK